MSIYMQFVGLQPHTRYVNDRSEIFQIFDLSSRPDLTIVPWIVAKNHL